MLDMNKLISKNIKIKSKDENNIANSFRYIEIRAMCFVLIYKTPGIKQKQYFGTVIFQTSDSSEEGFSLRKCFLGLSFWKKHESGIKSVS